MAKMKLDFSESKKVVYPEDEYSLRFSKKDIKSSSKGKPMIELWWTPFNPATGIDMSDYLDGKGNQKEIPDWISLAPNALFSLANLMFAAGVEKECGNCQVKYPANQNVCPSCQSAMFEFDPDFIDQIQDVRAFVIVQKDKNENDVNSVKTYIAPKP